MPLGATIVTDTIAKCFEDKPLYTGLTYNAHPVGCAAAVACINPPLIISAQLLREGLAVIDQGLGIVDAAVS